MHEVETLHRYVFGAEKSDRTRIVYDDINAAEVIRYLAQLVEIGLTSHLEASVAGEDSVSAQLTVRDVSVTADSGKLYISHSTGTTGELIIVELSELLSIM